jgi:hypothetical protein
MSIATNLICDIVNDVRNQIKLPPTDYHTLTMNVRRPFQTIPCCYSKKQTYSIVHPIIPNDIHEDMVYFRTFSQDDLIYLPSSTIRCSRLIEEIFVTNPNITRNMVIISTWRRNVITDPTDEPFIHLATKCL